MLVETTTLAHAAPSTLTRLQVVTVPTGPGTYDWAWRMRGEELNKKQTAQLKDVISLAEKAVAETALWPRGARIEMAMKRCLAVLKTPEMDAYKEDSICLSAVIIASTSEVTPW